MDRLVAVRMLVLDVGAGGVQEPHNLGTALEARPVDWRVPVLLRYGEVDVWLLQEQTRNLRVAVLVQRGGQWIAVCHQSSPPLLPALPT